MGGKGQRGEAARDSRGVEPEERGKARIDEEEEEVKGDTQAGGRGQRISVGGQRRRGGERGRR